MATNSTEYVVQELQDAEILLVEDGNHGEYRPRREEFVDLGIPFIRAADLSDGRVLFESASRINDIAYNRIRKGKGLPKDTLISHKGTVGKIAYASPDCEPFVCSPQTTFWRSLIPERLDPRYLYYYLHSNHFKYQLDARKGETDMADYVSLTAQRELKIQVPPIHVQREIVSILGSLDDKIELNRQMNQTLEAMAQAMFKSWFVDFDPVRARVDGRTPMGVDAETAALFPDGFQESELGPIPIGWHVANLGEVAINKRQSVDPSEVDPSTPYIGLDDMPRQSIALGNWGTASEVSSNKLAFDQGEILFGKLRPYFHKVGIAPVKGICSSDILVITPAAKSWLGFVLGHVTSKEFIIYTDAVSTGTRMPRVNWDSMSSYVVVQPPEEISEKFTYLITPFLDMIQNNIISSRTLVSIRDTLLPKLISGEIRVTDAEKYVEAAK